MARLDAAIPPIQDPTLTEAKRFWIGFDLGGTKMQGVLCDSSLKPLARVRKKSKGTEGAKSGIDRIGDIIEKLVTDAGGDHSNIAGIGIGCPGPVEWEKGIVRIAVNLGWKNAAIGPALSSRFHCPVSVLNDVDAGVYGEYRFGAAAGARCAIGLFPGTGIGGGCVYDGTILRGKLLTCMEVGHIRIGGGTRTSGIEMSGTLESEASRLTIAAECAKLAIRGEAPHLLEAAGTDIARIRSKTIAEAIAKGDKAVERVVARSMDQLGIAIVNMIHLLCPDKIVLGGGVVEAMPKLVLSEVEKTVKKYVLDCYADQYSIEIAKLGDDAGSLGAAAWVAHQYPEYDATKRSDS